MLLQAIEEKRFFPLGADKETRSDFQLIAGTNRDFRGDVAAGRFREGLLVRINLWTFRPRAPSGPRTLSARLTEPRTFQTCSVQRPASRFTWGHLCPARPVHGSRCPSTRRSRPFTAAQPRFILWRHFSRRIYRRHRSYRGRASTWRASTSIGCPHSGQSVADGSPRRAWSLSDSGPQQADMSQTGSWVAPSPTSARLHSERVHEFGCLVLDCLPLGHGAGVVASGDGVIGVSPHCIERCDPVFGRCKGSFCNSLG